MSGSGACHPEGLLERVPGMRDPSRTFEDGFGPLFSAAYRVAFAVVGDRGDAEDIAQEAMARALVRWTRLAGFEEAWIVRVSGNLAIDRVRSRERRRLVPLLGGTAAEPDGDRVDLQRALRGLPRRQREVAVLRFLGGFTEAEVASALGCSVGTVKQHSSRGLSALRQSMREGGSDVPAATRP